MFVRIGILFLLPFLLGADVYMGDARLKPDKLRKALAQAAALDGIDLGALAGIPGVEALIEYHAEVTGIANAQINLGSNPSGATIRAALVQVIAGDDVTAKWASTAADTACQGWTSAEPIARSFCGTTLQRGDPVAMGFRAGDLTVWCAKSAPDPEHCGSPQNPTECAPWVYVDCP